MLTRRTATVTISAPLASTAFLVSSKSRYLPVPTIRRDLKARPASSNLSFCILILLTVSSGSASAAADEVDNFNAIALVKSGPFIIGLGHHGLIYFHGDPLGLELEFLQQPRYRGPRLNRVGF